MATYSTYGTSAYDAGEFAELAGDRLGLAFVGHDSHYRGIYYLAVAGPHHIEIQPNALPDDDDGLYDPEHPDMETLLLLSGPSPDTTLTATLDSIDALVLLSRETL